MSDSVSIEKEIKKSYLEYSLSVIIGRAIPDVRDGLKPVHRRILYAMHELGNTYNRAYKKSARVVGDVIGKYHPHGDSSVYDALVRMAQDFSMRDPLVDGQGNFGSIDGDAPAAMRYTEVRMTRLGGEFLADIEKDTVDFRPNYDSSLSEPVVLPTKIPNLLLNGTTGIAVGMATNIPPHNLGELVDGLLASLDNPKITPDELMEFIKGPDFPTRGRIYAGSGLAEAYRTGRGSVKIRGTVKVEERRKGGESVIITEIPFGLNKSTLVEKIALLINEKRIEDVVDLRDESDRNGIRIVLDLKKGAISEIVINSLYKYTLLETSFGINMTAVVGTRPRILNIAQILGYFLEHRRETILRRSRHDLRKCEERAHILEGLRIALDNIDEVVSLIRSSKTPAEAKEKLAARFELTDVQCQAILDMRLQRLTNLEREKLIDEYTELLKRIAYLKSIIENPEVLKTVIREELNELKANYQTPRLTEIINEAPQGIAIEDLIPDEEVVITLSSRGYVKRTPLSNYQQQRRGGKGIFGVNTANEDFISNLIITSNHQYLLLFTNKGKMHQIKSHQIPEGSRVSKGTHMANVLPLEKDEAIATVFSVREFSSEGYFLFVTRKGQVKKSLISLYQNVRSSGLKAVNLDESDELITVRKVGEDDEIVLVTEMGKSIRFACSAVRAMGRNAGGVRGMALRKGDKIVSAVCIEPNGRNELLTISARGFGRRTSIEHYRMQARGGFGVINMRITPKTGPVLGAFSVKPEDHLLILTSGNKIIRINVSGISIYARGAQGVRLVRLEDDQFVVACDMVMESGIKDASDEIEDNVPDNTPDDTPGADMEDNDGLKPYDE